MSPPPVHEREKEKQVVQGGVAACGSSAALRDRPRRRINQKTKKKSQWRLLTLGSLS
jgi:hypothetical protein